jgi:FkbH-like protein
MGRQVDEKLVVAATFTAEPLTAGLQYWMNQLGSAAQVEFAPYNQVFQELLNPESAVRRNKAGMNILLVKFDDWLRFMDQADGEGEEQHLRRTFAQFTAALADFAPHSPCYTLLVICPPAPQFSAASGVSHLMKEFLQELDGFFQSQRGMGYVVAEDFHPHYQVSESFDSFTDKLGHVPYTTEYFSVLATIAARWYYSLVHPPYKVIVLDCDNTLWAGVCGEDGPKGVRVEGLFREFQEFLVDKANNGFLLCLCSKNNEEDVWNTFRENPGMVLKREHIVDYRINWSRKSENILSLAAGLNLGLDSFIFIDDNPVEIADVRTHCGDVLCVRWPMAEHDSSFLRHIWMLDKFIVTSEDKNRAESYKANVKREKLMRTSAGFSDFIKNLDLQVTVEAMPPEALPRAAQLTNRTNQFNFTTIRRSEHDIQALLDAGTHQCLITRVKDRFGDYGIVGVMIVAMGKRAVELDTFLLSCRVLGRGVEYRMLAHLGRLAKEKRKKNVRISFRKTVKNDPARLFIEKIASSHIARQTDEELDIDYPVAELSKLEFLPSLQQEETEVTAGKKKERSKESSGFDRVRRLEELAKKIATQLGDARALEHDIQAFFQPDYMDVAAACGENGDDELYILEKVKAAFSLTLHIPPAELDGEVEIDRYLQRNSLKIVEITSRLHKDFKTIPMTLLFERRTINDIVAGIAAARQGGIPTAGAIETKGVLNGGSIAIIGMNGRFPGAATIAEFWDNLHTGVNSVTVVPPERWDAEAYFAPGDIPGKSYSKWGGFIDGPDLFEASFFHISPREAEMMDPQQRLFLEVAWGLLEDAGYTPETISRKTGVFVGIIASDYNTISSGAALQGDCAYRSSDYYQIPNRVSYFFDFHGPSIAVDTACSASGAAIHMACQSMRQGDCDVAIAGGVNLFLHPSRFVQYSRMKILSPNGVCKPFGEGADGTVMGEGIAAVLLKPLNRAEADGDHIVAVIKGGAINSGGKTNGFTVPNPMAQADLVETALRDAGVDPATVGYIETHGTGTSLGDPIELRGLAEAFNRFPSEGNRGCAIGSVKSNIGHLESAAAVAGLIKILLQMKNRQLAPSLNAQTPNPKIDFGATPFFVQHAPAKWEPVATESGETVPLRAGLSTFGAGGVNVHLIVEEYIDSRAEGAQTDERHIIALSSVNEERLVAAAQDLLDFLSLEKNAQPILLADLAYTLQKGRTPLNERLAFVAGSIDECRERLRQFIEGRPSGRHLFRGDGADGQLYSNLLLEGREGNEYLQILVQDKKYEKLAQFWVSGATFDWDVLHGAGRGRRMSLPGFRFEGERYWIPTPSLSGGGRPLHPLLDDNVSTFMEQCFGKTFTAADFTIRDHVLDSRMVLPGVAYLEMARAAGSLSNRAGSVTCIKNIVWTKPVILDESSCRLHVGLRPKKTAEQGLAVDGWAYTIGADGARTDHARWSMEFTDAGTPVPEGERLDVDRIKSECTAMVSRDECYRSLAAMGFQYRHSFQVIQEVRYDENRALALLELPADLETRQELVLHPSLMDGALQSVVAWMSGSNKMPLGLSVPFTMGEVEIVNPLGRSCYVVSESADAGVMKFDVTILNMDGTVAVRIKEHYLRSFQPSGQASLVYLDAVWRRTEEPAKPETPVTGDLLVFSSGETITAAFDASLASAGNKVVWVSPGESFQEMGDARYQINPASFDDYRALSRKLRESGGLPDKIIHAWSTAGFEYDEESLDHQLHLGFYSIFYLTRAYMEMEVNGDVDCLYVYAGDSGDPQPQYAGVGGMVRSVQRENPRFRFKTMALDRSLFESPRLGEIALRELCGDTPVTGDIKWEGESRYERQYEELPADALQLSGDPAPAQSCFKQGGVYLITGGGGELGLLVAEYLAKTYKASLALCGRSDLRDEKLRRFEGLKTLSSDAVYFQADISRRQDVKELLAGVRRRFGRLDGIVHSAGAIRDSLVPNKTQGDIDAVLGPKVWGTMILDEESKEDRLDFFMIFSSISSRIGYLGQLDYAFANRYLDEFADMRRQLARLNERNGRTISINWPYWSGGGMQMDNATVALHRKSMGLWGLENDEGLRELSRVASSGLNRVMLIKGDRSKILDLVRDAAPSRGKKAATAVVSNEKLVQDLRRVIHDILKIPADQIEDEKELSHFGFDSLTFTDFANQINDHYQVEISPAIFYEYRTLKTFAAYLESEFPEALTVQAPAPTVEAVQIPEVEVRDFYHDAPAQIAPMTEPADDPVAIIGISAVLPGAKDVETFWRNLMELKDNISEIPAQRWNWRDYFGHPGQGPWLTDVKWGGFIDDVDKFDAQFFGISPREATLMDPQQRIFLETAWKTIEDAGYGPGSLEGTDTGVFVGVSINDYNELMKDWTIEPDAFISTGVNNSIIANRVSFLLDLRGPSEMIDTACSSSLVCVRHAVDCIKAGDCSMALVGAVNIMLRPKFHIAFRKTGILSGQGRCKTFDKQADGYVRAEGAAALLLKPLSRAKTDGDHIYAVIKGIAENHGGRAQSLTAPNPNAQADVIVKAWQNAGIAGDTIGYIEAHGTGTRLGDPIEINGLKKAFAQVDATAGHIGLGSVKTNVGHLEAVAGLAGVIKVLFAMKRRLIPASIHQQETNPLIDLTDTPFYIVSRHTPWKRALDHRGQSLPLRAGVSSFGFGGTNAHIVLEEYPAGQPDAAALADAPRLFVLSAKNRERLQEYARHLALFLRGGDADAAGIQTEVLDHAAGILQVAAADIDIRENLFDLGFDAVGFADLSGFVAETYSLDLTAGEFENGASIQAIAGYIAGNTRSRDVSPADVAYTLQVGRDAMAERLAIIASNIADLIDRLSSYRNLKNSEEPPFYGIEELPEDSRLVQMGRQWLDGEVPDWASLYPNGRPARIPLPVYPFARERYWLPEPEFKGGLLHPLVHIDNSQDQTIRFSTQFSGDEFFLAHHVVAHKKILPGVAYFEMARYSGEMACGRDVKAIRNVVWSRPAEAKDGSLSLKILLSPGRKGMDFKVVSNGAQGAAVTHAAGNLLFSDDAAVDASSEMIDVESIKARCSTTMDSDAFYRLFGTMGIECGPGFRPIQTIYSGSGEALAKIRLPEAVREDFARYGLHPTLIDGSLQTIVGVLDRREIQMGIPYLPFSVAQLTLHGPLPEECYAYVAAKGGARFDIVLTDRSGRVLVAIDDYVVRFLKEGEEALACYTPEWKPAPLPLETVEPSGTVLIWSADTGLANMVGDGILDRFDAVSNVIAASPESVYKRENDRDYKVNPRQEEDFSRLIKDVVQGHGGIDTVIVLWSRPDSESGNPAIPVFYLEKALLNESGGRPVNHLYVRLATGENSIDSVHFNALSGLARTVQLERENFTFKVVEVVDAGGASEPEIKPLLDELSAPEAAATTQLRVSEGIRWRKTMTPFPEGHIPQVRRDTALRQGIVRENGVYLITGGAGGLGAITSEFLAKETKGTLVLTGRSGVSPAIESLLMRLESLGVKALYMPADVSREEDVQKLIANVKKRCGAIHGIFHCAGSIEDSLLKTKTAGEIERVLAAKVDGTIWLDKFTVAEDLDLFVMYASVSGAMGNTGQSDYAYANSFMDHFAFWRDELRRQGKRSGATIAIDWPYWRDGGMRVNQETERFLSATWGMVPMDTHSGLSALAKGLELPYRQFMVVKGNRPKIARWIESQCEGQRAEKKSVEPASAVTEDFQEDMMAGFARLLGIDRDKTGLDDTFDKLGLSSIVFVDMANQLNARYGLEVIPSVFFQFSSPRQVIDYLLQQYHADIAHYYNPPAEETMVEPAIAESIVKERRLRAPDQRTDEVQVAVIGMSGRYPQSKDLRQFWRNLIQKKDLISSITEERWQLLGLKEQPFDSPEMIQAGEGGFIEDIDTFDAGFFHISRREAELMDPQQRVFLETVWSAIEDAGYRAGQLSGTRTGVFVGVANTDYFDVIRDSRQTLEAYVTTGNEHSVLANRISFLLNLKGPSQPVNTACSSSLVAVANAVDSLRTGRCNMAIAGGVNIISSRGFYITVSDAGMLADDGRCKAFDKRADGYVRGEGVGAVLLKPLDQARTDGDHIYAVVKGGAVNHGGRVSSLTVPNAAAQADLLVDAFADAGIPPWGVGYIEAHGTGTELGDPIEVEALKTAYEKMAAAGSQDAPAGHRIGVGTVKANVGHLEAAAGIAGVTKVVLSLYYKTIPGLVHFQELNPYINVQGTPFYFVKDTTPWTNGANNGGQPSPRRAGVSSFGFGGANAHVIFEEYREEERPAPHAADHLETPCLFVLSAKDDEQLGRYTDDFLDYFDQLINENAGGVAPSLRDIAYTSQVGREPMASRLAIVASTLDEVREKLENYIDDPAGHSEIVAESSSGLEDMAAQWLAGDDIDWLELYPGQLPKRVSLPTYPFKRQRYWAMEPSASNAVHAPIQQPAVPLFSTRWLRQDLPAEFLELDISQHHCVLVFDEDGDSPPEIEAAYNAWEIGPVDVVWVTPGESFQEPEEGLFSIDPQNEEHYSLLFSALAESGRLPKRVFHLWCLREEERDADCQDRLSRGVYSLFFVTRSLLRSKCPGDVRILFAYDNREGDRRPYYAACGGFSRTLAEENPNFFLKCVGIEGKSPSMGPIVSGILVPEMEVVTPWELEVQYRGNGRLVNRLVEQPSKERGFEPKLRLTDGGVYLITGGTGGLGVIFARYLATRTKGRLILIGRSDYDRNKEAIVRELNSLGAEAHYLAADITSKQDVDELTAEIRARFGPVNGVIHAAGVLDDSFIIKKEAGGFQSVVEPKVMGTVHIDHALAEDEADFIVLFSSIASVMGNSGQSDYAFANSFLDYFAAQRPNVISINWPLWQDGGMRVDAQSRELFSRQWGIRPLPETAGIEAFEEALALGISQVIVAYGADDSFPLLVERVQCRDSAGQEAVSVDTSILRQEAMDYLKGMIGDLLKLPPAEIDEQMNFGDMGVDSFIINKFNSVAGNIFPRLPKTLLFEYRNPAELLDYFLQNYQKELIEILDINVTGTDSGGEEEDKDWRQMAMNKHGDHILQSKDIAIIGVSGRYPGAASLDEFWKNISSGVDCITEIPSQRWDMEQHFHPDPEKAAEGKIYCKWGGFLADVDKFDHEFFNISPREAELIDPQERLFLETAWKTLEDAGYTRQKLNGRNTSSKERNVGVFVGLTTNDYPLLAAAEWHKGNIVNPRSYPWSVANRVSFFFDFHGPSIPVDTGCSSSLTAIYLACQSIAAGECSMALAGGVNVYLHPAKYIQMCAMRMLSPIGRCQTFGAGADGFVPGEGVGAVLLRPLAEAKRQGDHIYGVIKGGAINHGGNTNGYTVPNPRAQAELIQRALDDSGTDPRTIGYVEAHGTGTSLGDPIEMEGLSRAFAAYGGNGQHCALGSVKSNIGHLESAAGVAGVTKILLQMKHKKLAPSLHAAVPNPNIDFSHSPFFIQTNLTEWTNPADSPLRSAISSFGAGGTNVHLIVEEYAAPAEELSNRVQPASGPDRCLVVLSARNESSLRRYAADMADFLAGGGAPAASAAPELTDHLSQSVADLIGSDVSDIDRNTDIADFGLDLVEFNRLADLVNERYNLDLDADSFLSGLSINSLATRIAGTSTAVSSAINLVDVAYTLQVGREAMDERLAVAASDTTELVRALRAFGNGGNGAGDFFRGNGKTSPTGENNVKALLREGNILELGRLWVTGVEVNWPLLYLSRRPQPKRIPLPTYPFQKIRCWIGSKPMAPPTVKAPPVVQVKPDVGNISSRFLALLADVLYMKPEAVDETKPFVELGLDSVLGVELVNKVGKVFNVSVRATDLYDHPSVQEFSEFLAGLVQENPPAKAVALPNIPVAREPMVTDNGDIAIIGMSARLPGADDIWQFWNNLEAGVCSVTEVPAERWDMNRHFDPDPEVPNKSYCKWGGFLKDIDSFDSLFFSISPAEAASLEPQQRLFLEESWKALENAGYSPGMLDSVRCGVFVGVMSYNEYNHYHLFNSTSILSARIAYFLNLKGPALSIDTACSSSLVALHLACKNLVDDDAEMMLVGGVTLYLSEKQYIQMSRSGMLSFSGKCKTFDNEADGFVPAEGVTAVVLKTLSRARQDRDYIHGVIKGSNINQDGKTNGITAPSAKSQKDLEVSVYEKTGINPETISYVEAHGTGTNLGDPIEMEALNKSFSHFTSKRHFCGIGSVKTNLGHTSAAAGLASIVKVLLSLKHKRIPPSLFFKTPNRHIDFDNSPFYVVSELKEWQGGHGHPRRAAVSSFGFSGTNGHLIIEEPPERQPSTSVRQEFLIALSARGAESLSRKVEDLLRWLDNGGSRFHVGDISYTLLTGRSHFDYRVAFIVKDVKQLRDRLNALRAEGVAHVTACAGTRQGGDGERLLEQYRLADLIDLYLGGASLHWEKLFEADNLHRIPMPSYPFALKRHWLTAEPLETPEAATKPKPAGLQQKTVAVLNEILAKKSETKITLTPPRPVTPQSPARATANNAPITLKRPPSQGGGKPSSNGFKAKVKALVSKVLCLDMGEIDDRKRLADLGMDSIIGIELVKELNRDLRLSIKKEALYEYPSVDELSSYLSQLAEKRDAEQRT